MNNNGSNTGRSLIVISSPSGGGKSTIARYILSKYPKLTFSISVTTRNMRFREKNGVDYYFISKNEFQQKIENDEFIEYEEIFGNYYGTLKSEIARAHNQSKIPVFDIDVKGALSIKNAFPMEALLIFIEPPSIKTLEERLKKRSSETQEQIATRLARAKMEINEKDKFDYVITNEILTDTFNEIDSILIKHFILTD